MDEPADGARGGTRERLLAAGLRLFADRGFAQVGVGDIEQEVGLVPRRGALYRHFASKEELLETAVRRHLEAVSRAGEDLTHRAGADLVGAAAQLARRILAEMDAQRDITKVMERDGDRLPELRDVFRRRVSDTAYTAVAGILRCWVAECRPGPDRDAAEQDAEDVEAVAVLLSGALVNARRSAWTFRHPPAGRTDDDLVAAWSNICVATVRRLAGR